MSQPQSASIVAPLKAPQPNRPATDRDIFFSLAPSARREALELLFIAEERRNYLALSGATPAGAFRVLLAADYMLQNGSPDQKIAIMLQLLKDYKIDPDDFQDALEIGDAPVRPVNRQ